MLRILNWSEGMKYKTIIFDLDGTITDSQAGIGFAVKYALEKMGKKEINADTLRLFLGPPLQHSFMVYCGFNEIETQEAIKYYREYYHSFGWKQNKLYAGMFTLIRLLHKNGYTLGIATGKLHEEAVRILEYFSILKYFEFVLGTEANKSISKKEMIQKTASKSANIIMVGDRRFDIEAAQEAGVDSILASYGYTSLDELNDLEPSFRVQTVEEYYGFFDIEKPIRKSYFISLEGNDGTGKTTQCRLLCDRLSSFGIDVVSTREPGGCPISEKIRKLLLDNNNMGMTKITEALLFAAARAQHVYEVIKPALKSGNVVVSERYLDSSLAYQGGGHQLGEDVVYSINSPAINGCLPDLTLLFKVDYKTALHRRENATGTDRIEGYELDFHSRVQQSFEKLEKKYANRYLPILCDRPAQEIADEVFQKVLNHLIDAGVV